MESNNNWKARISQTVSYILVAALASFVTLYLSARSNQNKLDELRNLIQQRFIGEVTQEQLDDGAAAGMVSATGDRWSYYIPASQYAAHVEQMNNEYVGIGVTITSNEEAGGFLVQQVTPNSGAYEAGILAGDIIVKIDGQSTLELGANGASTLIRGKENTQIPITVLRDDQQLEFSVTRKTIQVAVAKSQMLDGNIGLVTIVNFDERCADETLQAIDSLLEQGAKSLIFDVRFNPGGYKDELVEVLDYLLPEGEIFHTVSYNGAESITTSDESCLEMPMAVLINDASYSAAEFFAAALSEYDWATMVGAPTTGKGYFQNTFTLSDGSAVGLSVGKYYTPKGVSLAETGGLKPDVTVEIDDETYAAIYAGTLQPQDDPQIQAAITALRSE